MDVQEYFRLMKNWLSFLFFGFLQDLVYDVGPNVIIDSASKALQKSDLFALILKSTAFGAIISGVSCSWGMTTQGGAKGVGESTTSAVVISLGRLLPKQTSILSSSAYLLYLIFYVCVFFLLSLSLSLSISFSPFLLPVAIFIADFFLSFAIFQGASSESIKACMV